MSAFSEFMKLFSLADGVQSKRNPLTGRLIKFTAAGRDLVTDLGIVAKAACKTASLKPLGAAAISASALVTRHVSYIAPLNFVAYKVRLFNADTAPETLKTAVTTQGALGDGIYNAATWEIPTFSGATSVAVPAASGASPEFVLGYIDSDIMYTPSMPYGANSTIVALRTYAASASNTRFDVGSSFPPSSLSATGMLCLYMTAADGVTTPSAFVAPTQHFSAPPIELIAYTDKQVCRIGLFGSSTLAGTGDTTSQGWAWRAQNSMSTDTFAYLFINHSQPSRTTAMGLAAAIKNLPLETMDAAVLSVYSTNDSDRATAGGLNRLYGQMRVFADECRRYGVKPYFATFQAQTGMTGTDNTNRKLVNQAARDYAATIDAGVFDLAGLLSDETQANGTWKNVAYTNDGTHPNALCAPVVAAYAATVFA